ncbi:E3 ubiquitin-protein ligase [Platanthera guangdongensis]|uniref:E3 ubiquitin-protein ligase n=1 Tax=Platanthera guangdongensis TaxID=2320717 RepID=A0ABR2M2B2_9ASPA
MTPPPPPPHLTSSSSIFGSYFLIIVATAVLLIIAVTLLLNSCRCVFMDSVSHSVRSWRTKTEPKAAEMIPVCRYRENQSFSTECSVCLTAFQDGEKVRRLPACRHSFHAPCVDMWLYSHSSCPSCRTPVPRAVPERREGVGTAPEEDSGRRRSEEREVAIAIAPAF